MRSKRISVKRRWEGRQVFGYGPTKEAALADVERKLQELRDSTSPEPTIPRTLHDYAVLHWEPRIAQKKPQTRRRYEDAYVNHIRPALGAMPIEAITPNVVQDFVNSLTKKMIHPNGKAGSKKRLMDPTGVRLVYGVLSQIMRLLDALDVIHKTPCRMVSLPPAKPKRERFLTPKELGAMLERCPRELYLPVFLSAVLGLRRGEVCGLQWIDVDRPNKTITIRRQVGRTLKEGRGVEIMGLKTSKSRKLVIPQAFIDIIDTYGNLDSEWVCTVNGEMWQPDRLTEEWTNWQSKPEGFTFHDLRHGAAGMVFAATGDILATSAILGHTKIDTTRIYVADAANKSGVAFEEVWKTLTTSVDYQKQ